MLRFCLLCIPAVWYGFTDLRQSPLLWSLVGEERLLGDSYGKAGGFPFHLATHFDAVFLRPPFAQRHHEIRRETHLLELPLSVLFDVFVIIAGRHHVALSFVDRSGLQVT